jgi:shikimate 5-dehydrogenase
MEVAKDMFDILHSSGKITCEVSCISKQNVHLVGHTKDSRTDDMSLDAVLGDGNFEHTGGHVLNFGAGGSSKAIALHLIEENGPGERPYRFVMINRSEPCLIKFKTMVESLDTNIQFEYPD